MTSSSTFSATAISSNDSLFPVYAAKLSSGDLEQYCSIAFKLTAWLDSPRAYYQAARPNIVQLVEAMRLHNLFLWTDDLLSDLTSATPSGPPLGVGSANMSPVFGKSPVAGQRPVPVFTVQPLTRMPTQPVPNQNSAPAPTSTHVLAPRPPSSASPHVLTPPLLPRIPTQPAVEGPSPIASPLDPNAPNKPKPKPRRKLNSALSSLLTRDIDFYKHKVNDSPVGSTAGLPEGRRDSVASVQTQDGAPDGARKDSIASVPDVRRDSTTSLGGAPPPDTPATPIQVSPIPTPAPPPSAPLPSTSLSVSTTVDSTFHSPVSGPPPETPPTPASAPAATAQPISAPSGSTSFPQPHPKALHFAAGPHSTSFIVSTPRPKSGLHQHAQGRFSAAVSPRPPPAPPVRSSSTHVQGWSPSLSKAEAQRRTQLPPQTASRQLSQPAPTTAQPPSQTGPKQHPTPSPTISKSVAITSLYPSPQPQQQSLHHASGPTPSPLAPQPQPRPQLSPVVSTSVPAASPQPPPQPQPQPQPPSQLHVSAPASSPTLAQPQIQPYTPPVIALVPQPQPQSQPQPQAHPPKPTKTAPSPTTPTAPRPANSVHKPVTELMYRPARPNPDFVQGPISTSPPRMRRRIGSVDEGTVKAWARVEEERVKAVSAQGPVWAQEYVPGPLTAAPEEVEMGVDGNTAAAKVDAKADAIGDVSEDAVVKGVIARDVIDLDSPVEEKPSVVVASAPASTSDEPDKLQDHNVADKASASDREVSKSLQEEDAKDVRMDVDDTKQEAPSAVVPDQVQAPTSAKMKVDSVTREDVVKPAAVEEHRVSETSNAPMSVEEGKETVTAAPTSQQGSFQQAESGAAIVSSLAEVSKETALMIAQKSRGQASSVDSDSSHYLPVKHRAIALLLARKRGVDEGNSMDTLEPADTQKSETDGMEVDAVDSSKGEGEESAVLAVNGHKREAAADTAEPDEAPRYTSMSMSMSPQLRVITKADEAFFKSNVPPSLRPVYTNGFTHSPPPFFDSPALPTVEPPKNLFSLKLRPRSQTTVDELARTVLSKATFPGSRSASVSTPAVSTVSTGTSFAHTNAVLLCAAPAPHVFEVEFSKGHIQQVQVWMNGRGGGDASAVKNGVCLSLACYRVPRSVANKITTNKPIPPAEGRDTSIPDELLERSCDWPAQPDTIAELVASIRGDDGGEPNGKGDMDMEWSVQLSPPVKVTPDGCVDMSRFARPGRTTFDIKSTSFSASNPDPDEPVYLYALYAHKPTTAQLAAVQRRTTRSQSMLGDRRLPTGFDDWQKAIVGDTGGADQFAIGENGHRHAKENGQGQNGNDMDTDPDVSLASSLSGPVGVAIAIDS
ncbi:hypothetical protein CONPUDRAFT_163616 [Coniophora puteana RWD-64-598 SS2]|uniref:Uncharacterized protein n=1 Tax=Coniophora puteana (strain RWD-64-598) TaxID=741705 RepID=A0A5M3N0E4_CONPW|nr:uncharacterized protein CONPUDRAFT_163616 [Coniophora puteana RWD-64-598 SS2]EIW84514.1 hypothetical protein CONPUDRAFT_163616 [Coniophora puteana RWD-64-598 SS2]